MPTATPPTIDITRLQGLADAASAPGVVTVRASSRTQIVEQLDKKNRNRAASWSKCPDCHGAREIQSTVDGLWDDCETCDGEGSVMGAVQQVTIPVVQVVAGRTTHSMDLLTGPPGRPDQWTARPQADIDAFVQSAAKSKTA